jgi:outer membrane protein OmpA-like peptidoglycan-associated protein
MKKLILMLALFSAVVMGANAQIATENSKVLDNISLGATVGVTSPLDMNSVFPVNTTFGLVGTKGITPWLDAQLEVLTSLGDNHFGDVKTAFRSISLGLNGAFNLPNIFLGYKGTPRAFETSAVLGIGARHGFDHSGNDLVAKTGFDFAVNFGKTKQHSVVLTPAIYWGLKNGSALQFNHNNANLSLMVTYKYHFKTSNGTRHFKTYDVGAMMNEINRLNEELAKKPTEVIVERHITQPNTATVFVNNTEWIVTFATASSELSNEAKTILNSIGNDAIVDVVGTASEDGTAEFNQKLSEDRAKTVAEYLSVNRGVRVASAVGKGVDKVQGRAAKVTMAQ